MIDLWCGCGEYRLITDETPPDFSVRCPKCGNWFGQGGGEE